MAFKDFLKDSLGDIRVEAEFLSSTYVALSRLGFSADNTIACVSICRDELCQSLAQMVNEKWGYAFVFSSLAGMYWAGNTGFLAAMLHSPQVDGKERYVFYAMAHIAVSEEGRFGYSKRAGREDESSACGALDVFQRQLMEGRVDRDLDFGDVELSLVRMRLLGELTPGQVPNILELTKIARKATQADLERAIESLIDTSKSDYALISGIQVHGPDNNYIWPATFYAVVNGVRIELR